MDTEHKAMLLQMVSEKATELDRQTRLAVATFGPAHPTVGKLHARLHRLNTLRVEVSKLPLSAAA